MDGLIKYSKKNTLDVFDCPYLIGSDFSASCKLGFNYNSNINNINTNFVKQIQWSPDGTYLLSSSNDNILRTFILPDNILEKKKISKLSCFSFIRCAEPIYSYILCPKMILDDVYSGCCLVSVRDHPIHLYDAFTSTLRASYPLIDHCEKFIAPNSLVISLDNTRFIAGSNNMLSIHALHMYGYGPITVLRTSTRHSNMFLLRPVQKGIISSLCLNSLGLLAAGTFNSTVGIYSKEGDGDIISIFNVGDGGVTQVLWMDDYKLLVVSRKSEKMSIWDIRTFSCIETLGPRFAMTQQRMTVDVWNDYIIAGSMDGIVRIWKNYNLAFQWRAHHDVVSSSVVHPLYPLIATCSGSRKYNDKYIGKYNSNDKSYEFYDYDNSIKLWYFSKNMYI